MLEEVKNYLAITWQDDDIDKKLNNMIDESKQSINNLIGDTVDFEEKELKELLFNRIRYAYNNAIEYFEGNFSSQILRLQLQKGVDCLEK